MLKNHLQTNYRRFNNQIAKKPEQAKGKKPLPAGKEKRSQQHASERSQRNNCGDRLKQRMRQREIIIQQQSGGMRKEEQAHVMHNNPGLGEQPFLHGKIAAGTISAEILQRMAVRVEKNTGQQQEKQPYNPWDLATQPLQVQILKEIPFVERNEERKRHSDLF